MKKGFLFLILFFLYAGLFGQNLLDMSNWTIGTGSSGQFIMNGQASENSRVWGTGPNGKPAILWRAQPEGNVDADGGWTHSSFAIDHTKMYRLTVWIKKTNSYNGTTYFGTYGVTNLDGTANGDPYFWNGDLPELNRWYLLVAYVHGSGDNSLINSGGIYDGTSGIKIGSMFDFKLPVGGANMAHRTYLFHDPNTSDEQLFYAPRAEVVNGQEPPISSLIGFESKETVTRDNAGLRGDAGAISGFSETVNPTNFPTGAASWWHLLDVRHSNMTNNYAMQFAGSFFDQNLWVRKTNNNPAQPWSRVVSELNGRVGINTLTPQVPFHVIGNSLMEDNLKIIAKDAAWAEGLTIIKPVGWSGIRLTRFDPATGNYLGNWAIGYTAFSGNDFSISNSNANGQNDALFHINSTTLNVGIGTANPNEKLAVNGKIRAKEIKVEAAN